MNATAKLILIGLNVDAALNAKVDWHNHYPLVDSNTMLVTDILDADEAAGPRYTLVDDDYLIENGGS